MTRTHLLHFLSFVVAAILLGLTTQYFGWMIVERMAGEPRFPGFLSREMGRSLLDNTLGALVVGSLLAILALPFARFRRSWKHVLPRLFWAGLLLFYAYMAILVGIGLRAV